MTHKLVIKSRFRFFSILGKISIFDFKYGNRPSLGLKCPYTVTRGNKFKLQNQTFNHNFRKYFFTARIVHIWNTLPNYVVDVLSVDLFKLRLDKFWALLYIMFAWTADLTGTGNRSECIVEIN